MLILSNYGMNHISASFFNLFQMAYAKWWWSQYSEDSIITITNICNGQVQISKFF